MGEETFEDAAGAKRGALRHITAERIAALLLVAMAINLLTVTAKKSITIDETVMIPSAYYHTVAGKFELVHEHPPLAKFLAALPLLLIQPEEIPPGRIDAPPHSDEEEWAYQTRFWNDNGAAFETISFWARVPMIALTLLLGVLIFVFARELFGARAAALAVALYSLEPTVLAHGRVVQTDVPAAFGYLLFIFALYRYVRAPTWRRAAWVGAATALAILAKFSMLLTGPILAAIFLALLWRAPRVGPSRSVVAAHAALIIVVLLFIIQAAYYFHSREIVGADVLWIEKHFPAHNAAVLQAVSALSYILPTDFVLGIFWQVWHNGDGHPASLLGMYSRTGWWFYFPVAFALKTTIPFLLLSLASIAFGAYKFARERDARLLVILAPFAVYTAFVLLGNINIGVRYYLPAFPFLFIMGGALLERLLRSKRAHRAGALVAVSFLCWMGVEAARAYPDQMSYMNQLAANHPHWWYLSDSNVEWGDDVGELAEYLKARGERRVSAAFLGGFLTPHLYGVEYVDLLSPSEQEPEPTRYVAIGASFLNGSTVPQGVIHGHWPTEDECYNFFDAYRRRTPEAVIGGSIYLFREDGQ